MAASYLSPLLWSFLPPQITHFVLPTLSSSLPSLLPPAPRGSPLYARNYRLVITVIVLGWLTYAFVTDRPDETSEDWYSLLGVSAYATDDELRRAFRTLSRLHHPDRAGVNNEAVFISIRHAYEGLSDPIRRHAYDRFGPLISQWKNVASVREYIIAGMLRSSGFYIASAGLMFVLSLFGKAREGAYWRYVLFAVLLVVEINLIVSASPSDPDSSTAPLLYLLPFPLTVVVRRLLPLRILAQPQYLQIQLLHRLWADTSIAINQLAGVWSDLSDDNATAMLDNQILSLANQLQRDSSMSLGQEVAPLMMSSNDPAGAERNLLRQMEEILLDRAVTSHPLVASAWKTAVQRASATASPARGQTRPDDILALASSIPLPPSPPQSPVLGPRHLS